MGAVPLNHVADLSQIAAAVRGNWFDLYATLADPRHSEFCLRLYQARPTGSTGPRPAPTADLLVRGVRNRSFDDPTIQWLMFRDISYDGAERTVLITANPSTAISLHVAAINVRLLERA